jgi:transposase
MDALLADPTLPLPSDVPTLQALVRQLLAEVGRLRDENARLQQRLDQALRLHFGPRSERRRPRTGQRRPREGGTDDASAPAGHGRAALPAELPRERIAYEPTEAEKVCPGCGQTRVCLGEQVSEQLDYRPACFVVVQHVKKTLACLNCDGPAEQRFTTTGPPMVGPIAKGLAGPSLLAHVITSKYADHLPLHRLEGIVARSGVRLSRSTLCDWMAAAAVLVGPLVALFRERLLQSRAIHSDDTPVPYRQVGQERTATGHLWVYIGDRDHPYVVFDFTTHYRRDGPESFLNGYVGYLQADALAQYEGLFAPDRVVHAACWAHARRRFVEAQGSAPEEAEKALQYIRDLYRVERELAKRFETADDEGRQRYRQTQTAVVRAALRTWLQAEQGRALPKSPLGEAIAYTLKHWEALGRYTEQGYLAIDNNLAERTLRPVALGRNNWQYCGSVNGGKTAAALFSVVGTCKHLELDPFAYLRDVLPALFSLGETPSQEALAEWLPDVWQKRQQRAGPEAAGETPAEPVTARA